MPKCVYCGKIYEFPRGLTLVMKDGTINYLCSPKCKKNMLMKRRRVEWVRKSDTTKALMKKEVKK
jgi:large subunit ribosomal protein L24e